MGCVYEFCTWTFCYMFWLCMQYACRSCSECIMYRFSLCPSHDSFFNKTNWPVRLRCWVERRLCVARSIRLKNAGILKLKKRQQWLDLEWIREAMCKKFIMLLSNYGLRRHRNRALRGVLFWRWDLNVYEGMPPADYGLLAEDSTFDIVRQNADQVKSLMVSIPPAPSCKLGCWVPVSEQISSKKSISKYAPVLGSLL